MTTKSFIKLGTVANIINMLGIIYATSCAFPYDFDSGYADCDIITSKKVFITFATGVKRSGLSVRDVTYT